MNFESHSLGKVCCELFEIVKPTFLDFYGTFSSWHLRILRTLQAFYLGSKTAAMKDLVTMIGGIVSEMHESVGCSPYDYKIFVWFCVVAIWLWFWYVLVNLPSPQIHKHKHKQWKTTKRHLQAAMVDAAGGDYSKPEIEAKYQDVKQSLR